MSTEINTSENSPPKETYMCQKRPPKETHTYEKVTRDLHMSTEIYTCENSPPKEIYTDGNRPKYNPLHCPRNMRQKGPKGVKRTHQKRPPLMKRDLHLWKKTYTYEKRLACVKRDHQKRPIIMKRVLHTYNETYIGAFTLYASKQHTSKET